MELKKELLEFLEANNLFGLEDMENAEGVIDNYLKVYKKQLTLTDVSQQRELLLAYERSQYETTWWMSEAEATNRINDFLANNCC